MTKHQKKRVLVVGATGMLGATIFRYFCSDESLETFGTVRDAQGVIHFDQNHRRNLITNVYLEGENGILNALDISKPDIVINCAGIIKQLPDASDHIASLTTNATLPHRLAKFCSLAGSRLIHFSTDCVFSGSRGEYREDDFPDAYDLYGRTKLLGEVDYENAITLRTSIIGHELSSSKSLVNWFLSQTGDVSGFKKAIFSGLPTIEVARVVRQFVIPNPNLRGLYHLSSGPISKYDLLVLISNVYRKNCNIIPNDSVTIDRSLNSDKFRRATGFTPKTWPDMINDMHKDYRANTQNP